MNTRETYIPGHQVRSLQNFNVRQANAVQGLRKLGISFDRFDRQVFNKMLGAKEAMDSIQPTITTASIATPVQFLQAWLPGFVEVVTAARKIDELVGIMNVGEWEDEEVVQGLLELTGYSVPYGDYTNIPLSSWNVNFERRTIIRFEEGMRVGKLEEARTSRMQVDDAGKKRKSAALALEIIRNTIGFFGFNSGNNRTYGYLNDPNLPAYVTVPNGASGSSLWANKTYLEITKDIRSAIASLRSQSQDTIDPRNMELTLAVATNSVDYLSTVSDFGNSVWEWLKDTYPGIRVVSAPQLNAANGGANVFYLYADRVDNDSTDDGRVFIQPVPTKFLMLGVEQKAKAYIEAYSNATAGIMCKRPYAVVRRSGI